MTKFSFCTIIIRRDSQVNDKKKVKHKKIEQKRRDGIKQKMDILRSYVPNCTNETQAIVLEKTAEYIELLKEQYADLLSRSLLLENEYKTLGGTKELLGEHSVAWKEPQILSNKKKD